jgi:hypothetical protein
LLLLLLELFLAGIGTAGAAAGSALGNFAVGERDVGNVLAMNAAMAYGIGTLAGAAASSNGLNAASAGFDSAGNVTQSSGIGFDYSLEGSCTNSLVPHFYSFAISINSCDKSSYNSSYFTTSTSC